MKTDRGFTNWGVLLVTYNVWFNIKPEKTTQIKLLFRINKYHDLHNYELHNYGNTPSLLRFTKSLNDFILMTYTTGLRPLITKSKNIRINLRPRGPSSISSIINVIFNGVMQRFSSNNTIPMAHKHLAIFYNYVCQ